MMETTKNCMPEYVSHKRVWALEIKTVGSLLNGQCMDITYSDQGYENIIFKVPDDMIVRYKPIPGDFHVHYEDGYSAFSPRKAFIDGYKKV